MKTKRPYAAVERVAHQLLEKLAPACERIELAGSLRRRAERVGDIEIVAIPRLNRDLFGQARGTSAVDDLLLTWPVELTRNGAKFKQFMFATGGGHVYQCDLFLQPDPATWAVNFMIRTGSAEFSRLMVTPRNKGGYMPNDLHVADARVWRGHEQLDVPEEEDLFALWEMAYIPPPMRTGRMAQ